MREVLMGLGALAAMAFVEGLYYTLRFFSEKRRDELRRRLQTLRGTEAESFSLLRQGKLSSSPYLDDLLRGLPIAERLELLLEQAALDLTVAQIFTYSLGASLLAGAGGALLGGVLFGALLFLAGLFAPLVAIVVIRDERSRKVSEQLPDALDMMSRSLRAGHALSSAFKLVASEMPAPVSIEFGRAFEEQNLGMPFERAVVQMTRRVPTNRDLKIFAVSVIVQKETGGNLVEILEKIAETIRGRYRFYGKVQALTAEGRLSAWVLAALPSVVGIIATVMNAEYMSRLVNTYVGRLFLAYAFVSWLLGLLWLRQTSKVDY
jgi:tight adherence protein B